MAMKSSKLGKLQMPTKKPAFSMDDLRKEMSESPEDEEKESPEQQKFEDESGLEMHGDESDEGAEPASEEETSSHGSLDDVSDDELMAELRKRGLDGKAKKAAAKASDDSNY